MAEMTSQVIPELSSHENGATAEVTFEMLLGAVVLVNAVVVARDRTDVAKKRDAQGREIRQLFAAELTSRDAADKRRAAVAW